MVAPVTIAGRQIGGGAPCFIVAEVGVNHNGDVALATRLVEIAARSGADAVKFQTFKAEQVATPQAPKAGYQLQTTGVGESQVEMLRRLELSEEAHRALWDYCRARGILFMSTPFDEASADLLEALGVAVFKMSSGELTNLPFLAYVARKGKPMIVSTGMSTLAEVQTAVQAIHQAGNRQLVLLHCVSSYPTDPREANLRAMPAMAQAFQVPVGYSDHTPGIEVALAAVTLGACVIEKHLTLDRTLPGPDHQASLEPHELSALVKGIRTVESALGHGRKEPAASECGNALTARRSLVAAQDLRAGMRLASELIAIKRPGTGLPPAVLPHLIGRTMRVDVPAGSVLGWEMLE
ncbi:MAG: N-acetylneuraminate synthase [Candidatus Omnitrophota bacterium]|nr:N-acetylneuraminate synthase [Candidatus Omnitrophota bacterium]